MACGCSKGSLSTPGVETVYIFTDTATGRQTTYRTLYEAKYAKTRAEASGSGGNIREEAKT